MTMPVAVHFGAGNIGRGFVGLVLHNAGFEVVFVDVNAELIDKLAATPTYQVHEVGDEPRTELVDNYRALNSATHELDVIAEIAIAVVVTTAVGPNILRFVAPLIARGLELRSKDLPPVAIMACENAVNATDTLRDHVVAALSDDTALARGVFANTAVDRIVPAPEFDGGLDVTVESFFEWAIESTPFAGSPPEIREAHFVENLEPYIERKLYTVNTGHATAAYHGFVAGAPTLAAALAIPAIFDEVTAVLHETQELLVAKHGFPPEVQRAYLEQNLKRFVNPALSDSVARVARQPLRKLSRTERFIGPAAQLAERGIPPVALLRAIAAVLQYDEPSDEQSVELNHLLDTFTAEEFVANVTGIEPGHPLYAGLIEVVSVALKNRDSL